MKILLIDESNLRLNHLREALQELPAIGFMEVPVAVYMMPPSGLDAVFMTLPAAEKWGPDFRSRKAQILRTSQGDQENGFPPLVVTGVNLTPNDPRDPFSQVRILLESALAEVREYNKRVDGRIENLGFWVVDLTRGITTDQLIELMREPLLSRSVEDVHV